MANEDKFFIFQDPVEDHIVGYTKIIKTPMCFAYVRTRAKSGMYLSDPQALRRDIALIFENAIKFNLPKHKVHKEAKKLGQICNAMIDSIQSKLELNAARTLDESTHRQWMKLLKKIDLFKNLKEKGSKMLRAPDVKEHSQGEKPEYQLQHDELFDV